MRPKCGAKIEVYDNNVKQTWNELPDDLALSYGRVMAASLSDEHDLVLVTLSDGTEKVIGFDTIRNRVVIGHLKKGKTW